MKTPLKIILVGALAVSVLVIGSLLTMQSTTSAFAQSADTPTPAAPTAPTTAPSGDAAAPAPSSSSAPTSSFVELWDKFCVAKVPYTLLALPQDATFSVSQPSGVAPTPAPGYTTASQTACDSVGVFRGKQVLVCRGPQLTSIGLKISSGGASQDYQVPLKECALPHTTAPAGTPAP